MLPFTASNSNPYFRLWCDIRQRCYNPKSRGYKFYGERGIRIAEPWHDFYSFVLDILGEIGPRPEGCELDRTDNNGDYEPNNIRWVTHSEQMRNRRSWGRSSHKGVSLHACGKWQAYGDLNKTRVYLGLFASENEAVQARTDWENAL